MTKTLGYSISLAVLFFGAIGNYHLYKEAGEWNESIRNVIILVAAVGVEMAVLLLIHSVADKKLEGNARSITCGLLLLTMPVSLMGQYAYLLKEASVKVEKVNMAKDSMSENSSMRASLESEKATLLASLNEERKSSWGKKCELIQTRIDGVNTRLDSLNIKTEVAQVAAVEVTELSVLAKEFGMNEAGFTKTLVGVFLIIANFVGFWLVYLASLKPAAAIATETAIVAPKRPARRKAAPKGKPLEMPLPANVVQFPKRQVSMNFAN